MASLKEIADSYAPSMEKIDKEYGITHVNKPADTTGVSAQPQKAEEGLFDTTIVKMADSDGKVYRVPASQVDTRKQQGYTVATEQQILDHQALKKVKQDGFWSLGTVRLVADKALSGATFGVSDVIEEHTLSPEELARKHALEKEHNILGTAAELGGGAASLLLTGGSSSAGAGVKAGSTLGKEALSLGTNSLARVAKAGVRGAEDYIKDQFTSNVVKKAIGATATVVEGGATGVAYSVPKALTEAAFGDYDAAAETISQGAKFGAIMEPLAVGVGKLGSAAKPVTSSLKQSFAPYLDADLASAKALNSNPRNGALAEISAGSKKAGERADALKEVGAFTREEGILPKLTETKQEYLDNTIIPKKQAVGEEIGDLIKKTNDVIPIEGIDKKVIYKDLEDRLIKQAEARDLAGTAKEAYVENAKKEITANIRDLEDKAALNNRSGITIQDLHEQRSSLDNTIKWNNNDLTQINANQIRRDVRTALNDVIDDNLRRIEGNVGTELADQLKAARKKYWNMNRVQSLVEDDIERGSKNNAKGLSTTLKSSAVEGAVNTTGSVLSGSPILGLIVGKMAGVVQDGIGMMADRSGWSMIANTLDRPAITGIIQASRMIGNDLSSFKQRLADSDLSTRFSYMQFSNNPKQMQKDFEDHTSDIQATVGDPLLQDKLNEYAKHLSEGGAPQTAQAFLNHQNKILNYIVSINPKLNAPQQSTGFGAKQNAQIPSSKIKEYEENLSIIYNPIPATEKLIAEGKLKPSHVKTFKEIYPKLYGQLTVSLENMAKIDGAKKLPYSQKKQIELFLQQSSKAPQKTQTIQEATYKEEKPEPPKNIPPPKFNITGVMTESQRVSSK